MALDSLWQFMNLIRAYKSKNMTCVKWVECSIQTAFYTIVARPDKKPLNNTAYNIKSYFALKYVHTHKMCVCARYSPKCFAERMCFNLCSKQCASCFEIKMSYNWLYVHCVGALLNGFFCLFVALHTNTQYKGGMMCGFLYGHFYRARKIRVLSMILSENILQCILFVACRKTAISTNVCCKSIRC